MLHSTQVLVSQLDSPAHSTRLVAWLLEVYCTLAVSLHRQQQRAMSNKQYDT